ncbi:hypothetical protein KI387_014596, partial [Taxus chinensis]
KGSGAAMESRVFGRIFQLLHSRFSRGHLKTKISLPKEYAKSAYSVSRRNTSTISKEEETQNEQDNEGLAETFTVAMKKIDEHLAEQDSVQTEKVYERHCQLLGSVLGSEKDVRKLIIKSAGLRGFNAFLTMEQAATLRRHPEVAEVLVDSTDPCPFLTHRWQFLSLQKGYAKS